METAPCPRVLVVEDDALVAQFIEFLLLDEGCAVAAIARDGRDAVAAVLALHPDVVVMDVEMPEMDGIEATRRIRELQGYADVPILALTANVLEEDRRACLSAGMNDFVAKPVDPAKLRAKLSAWLRPRAPGDGGPAIEHARKVIERLQPLVTSDDTDALHVFELHAEVLIACCPQEAGTLRRQLQRYDFAAASETLRHLESLPACVGDAERSAPS